MSRKRVAILISGRGSNMSALIEATKNADFPAEIVLVLSNRPGAQGLAHAAEAGVPTQTIDHVPFGSDRQAFDSAVDEALRSRGVELICLAGFMRLLTPWFVEQWHGRLLNIHPALLPAFKGLDTHARALAAGVKIHGASVHFVVPEMDSGPIIAQGALPVSNDDTPDSLARRVLSIEHRLYPTALGLVAEGRVHLHDGRCIIDGVSNSDTILLAPEISSRRS
jgi:phosphoribosylglycinamide formyltransferase 1